MTKARSLFFTALVILGSNVFLTARGNVYVHVHYSLQIYKRHINIEHVCSYKE